MKNYKMKIVTHYYLNGKVKYIDIYKIGGHKVRYYSSDDPSCIALCGLYRSSIYKNVKMVYCKPFYVAEYFDFNYDYIKENFCAY